MQFMYQYPDIGGTDVNMMDAGPVAELARVAEESGWAGFAFTEHPAPGRKWLESGGHQTLDPFVALGHVAAVTTHLRLLTYLTVLPYRNPMMLAKSASTVDILSGGRLILGVGTGYNKSEYFALGVDFEERNALFEEALDVLPQHWSGEAFDYEGLHFSARDVISRPPAVQQPIPIWIGGNSKLTRRRIAARAQGWIPMTGGPVEMYATTRTPQIAEGQELTDAIAALREDAGERGDSLDIAVAYTDDSVHIEGADFAKHRDAIAALEASGVNWVIVPGRSTTRAESVAFLERAGNGMGMR